MSRSLLEHALWDLGVLDDQRQAAIDERCRGDLAELQTCRVVTLDPAAYRITAGSLADQQLWIPLSQTEGDYVIGGPHGVPAIMVFDENLKKVGAYPVDDTPAVLLADGLSCRYTKAFRSQAYLPYGAYVQTMLVPDQASAYGPVDLMVAPAGDQALVIDRGLGTAYHVDLAGRTVLSRVKVRVAGLAGGISAAWMEHRLYLVDVAAEKLIVYDLRDGAIISAPPGLGNVSSVVASPDGQVLYLCGAAPSARVLAVDPDSFEIRWQGRLPGEPFTRLGDPLGVPAVSPDGRLLMVVTAFAEPEPGTPVIAALDTATGKVLHRLRIPAGRRPAAVAFGVANPYHADLPDVDEAIVQLGYMTATELTQIKEGLGHEEVTEDLTDVSFELADLAEDGPWRGGGGEAVELGELPVEIEPIIAEYLTRAFQEQTGLDAHQDDAAWTRITATAAGVREHLQAHGGMRVVLRLLSQGRDLVADIGLEQVAEWLDVLAEVDVALVETLAEMELSECLEDVPENCPACHAALYGSYACPSCQYAVVSDSLLEAIVMRVKPRDILGAEAADPRMFLPPDHLLVPDPARQRVVELDRTGAIIWSLEPERLEPALRSLLQWPVDALRLANDNTLIIDRGGRRVFEVTPTGRPYWEWPASAGQLGEPVRVGRNEWGETYIVDRAHHRIWRADANGLPLPGYGEGVPGIAPGRLCRPGDVHLLADGRMLIADTGNHRVIEVANGEIVWQYGNPAGVSSGGAGGGAGELDTPQRAQRLEDGRTLILDSGNHRLLIVDQDGAVVRSYDTVVGEEGMDVTRPLRMMTLPKGHLAYWDQQRLVEIDPDGKIVWAADLANLDANPRLQTPEPTEGVAVVWNVKALAKDDPDRQALEAERAKRRDEARAARKIFSSGDTMAYVDHLKSVAWRRVKKGSAPKHWKINLEVLERLVAQNRILLMKKRDEVLAEKAGFTGPNFGRRAPKPAFRTREAPETVDPGTAAVPLLAVQTSSSRLVLLARNQQAIWSWGMTVLKEPNAAVLLPNRQVLVADTGNHRVLIVDIETSEIVWQSAPNLGLQSPLGASRLANGHLLIADAGNRRVIEVAPDQSIVWQVRNDSVLQMPASCERLENGNTLIADRGTHLVVEIDPAGALVWSYGHAGISSKSPGFLSHPEHASRRASGHTLIVDGRNHRVLDVDPGGTVAWSYAAEGANRLSAPTDALVQGPSIWIAHAGGRQIFEVNRAGEVLWRYSSAL